MIQTLNVDPNGVDARQDLAIRGTKLPLCIAVDALTRAKYAARSEVTLLQNVLLHSGVCPDHLGTEETRDLMRRHSSLAQALEILMGASASAPSANERQLWRNLRTARLAAKNGSLPPAHAQVIDFGDVFEWHIRVVDFDRWAAAVKLPIVGPWPTRNELLGRRDGVLVRFPHETTCLVALARVAWHFYSEATGNPANQPDNGAVSAWAHEKCGVSGNLADAMATLLRPDDAARGRPAGRRGRTAR